MQQVNPPYIPKRAPEAKPSEVPRPAPEHLAGQTVRYAHSHPQMQPQRQPQMPPRAVHNVGYVGAKPAPALRAEPSMQGAHPQRPIHPEQSANPHRPAFAPDPARMAAARRDPAPSRLAYRMQRLWLTPVVRSLTRIGLPVFAVVLGLGAWLGDDTRRADLIGAFETLRDRVEHQPAFMVSLLKIEGASPEVDAAIRMMVPADLPASSFDLDLNDYRREIRRLDAVADARLVINGDTLEVVVTERQPVVLWRTWSGLEMLDETGHRVANVVSRDVRADLPLVTGEGADRAVPEAVAILRAAGPILPRIRGLERVGERRWDIVLDRDQRLMLPEETPVRALDRILALDKAEDLLSRDFTHLDLRNAERPTIRLSEHSLDEFQGLAARLTQTKAGQ